MINKIEEYLFNCKSLTLKNLMFELVCDYVFNKEELLNNEYFNDNDKKLIIKCCNMLDYLYLLQTRRELKPSEGIFSENFVKSQIDEMAK